MSLSPILSRDIVATRLLFNAIKREKYMDFLRDAVVGDYKWSACNVSFHGWMKCDGSALSRTTYSALYNVIGTTYGSNNASDFKLPDCRGRALFAAGQPTNGNIEHNPHTLVQGELFGNQLHRLTLDEMPSHRHTGPTDNSVTGINVNSGTTVVTSGNTRRLAGVQYDGPIGQDALISLNTNTIIDPSHNHAFTTSYKGGNNGPLEGNCTAHNIENPSIVVGNVFIYSGVYEPYVSTVDVIGLNDNEYNA
jgi:microcystin-dependent protein